MPESALELDDVSFDSYKTIHISNLDSEDSGILHTEFDYNQIRSIASSESIKSPINIDPYFSVICDEDTSAEIVTEGKVRVSSTEVAEFLYQRRLLRLSAQEWLNKGLPPEATEKLRWILSNLKEMFPDLYDEVMTNSQEFTRSELLSWLDIVGTLVPPEGTDVDTILEELDQEFNGI